MGSLWSFVTKPKNRQVLSWAGGGIAVAAAGLWAVVTYVWPPHEPPKVVCAQQGSVAAGGNASGNIITFNGPATAGAGSGAAPCVDTAKK